MGSFVSNYPSVGSSTDNEDVIWFDLTVDLLYNHDPMVDPLLTTIQRWILFVSSNWAQRTIIQP